MEGPVEKRLSRIEEGLREIQEAQATLLDAAANQMKVTEVQMDFISTQIESTKLQFEGLFLQLKMAMSFGLISLLGFSVAVYALGVSLDDGGIKTVGMAYIGVSLFAFPASFIAWLLGRTKSRWKRESES
ncbi:hypothetical protein ES703_01445 [subsurface metagenome]